MQGESKKLQFSWLPGFLIILHSVVFLFSAACLADEPPRFTGGRVYSVDTHTAMIEWQTNLPTNGRIDYGETMKSATRVSLVVDVGTLHQTLLFNLKEGEEHVYRIFATDTQGRQIRSNWAAFRTLGMPAPRITGVFIKELMWYGARLEWTSNTPVKGLFECGYDTGYGYSKLEPRYGAVHEVALDRFSPRKTIHYRITAQDRRRRETVWTGTFQTDEHNIALRRPVAGTFIRNPDRPHITDSPPLLQRVTDGKTDYFTGMATSGDPGETDQRIEIDLESIQDASVILTYWRRLAYPQQFSLRGSLDGERWYEFGDTYSADDGRQGLSETGDPILIHTAPIGNYAIRFVRLEIPKGAPYAKKFENYRFVQLFEIKVYPTEPEDPFLKFLKQKR